MSETSDADPGPAPHRPDTPAMPTDRSAAAESVPEAIPSGPFVPGLVARDQIRILNDMHRRIGQLESQVRDLSKRQPPHVDPTAPTGPPQTAPGPAVGAPRTAAGGLYTDPPADRTRGPGPEADLGPSAEGLDFLTARPAAGSYSDEETSEYGEEREAASESGRGRRTGRRGRGLRMVVYSVFVIGALAGAAWFYGEISDPPQRVPVALPPPTEQPAQTVARPTPPAAPADSDERFRIPAPPGAEEPGTAAAPTPPVTEGPANQAPANQGTSNQGTAEQAPADGAGFDPGVLDTDRLARPAPAPDQPNVGPAVQAVPVAPVQVASLDDASPEATAPLPADAPEDVVALAERALDGDADAQHDLATVYAIGRQVPQDFDLAAYWYARAADNGITNATYNLGVLTERGLGVPQDSEAAFDLFLEAARAGHADAQNAVGLAYSNGRGVEVDLIQAASWFQAASTGGNARGAYHLGRMFEQGLDGAPDPAAAYGWYRIAADLGDEDARAAAERLEDRFAQSTGAAPDGADGAAVPDTAPEPTSPPGDGDEGTEADLDRGDIREVQRSLQDLGYDPGPADGLMGANTRTAIRAFQEDRGLSVTGQATPGLLDRLRRAISAQ